MTSLAAGTIRAVLGEGGGPERLDVTWRVAGPWIGTGRRCRP
jgi:hypothetical protein